MIVNDIENKNRSDEFNSHPRYTCKYLIISEFRLAGVILPGQQRGSTLSDNSLFSLFGAKKIKKNV